MNMGHTLKVSFIALCLLCTATTAYSGFADEDVSESGVTNPSDFSWRYYKEAMKRFPERIGIICHAAYLLDKTGSFTAETLEFLKTCADHGSVAAMIYLSSMYEHGSQLPIDYTKSAQWLKRGADSNDEAGYCYLASFHYGVVLAEGRGVTKDMEAAIFYLKRAKNNGITEADDFLMKMGGATRGIKFR